MKAVSQGGETEGIQCDRQRNCEAVSPLTRRVSQAREELGGRLATNGSYVALSDRSLSGVVLH